MSIIQLQLTTRHTMGLKIVFTAFAIAWCVRGQLDESPRVLLEGLRRALTPWCPALPAVSHPTCWLCTQDDLHLHHQRLSPSNPYTQIDPDDDLPAYRTISLSEYIRNYSNISHTGVDPRESINRLAGGEPQPTYDLSNPIIPTSMARVYADVNANMPRSYWDYDSVNIAWGALENYEVVRKIGSTHTFGFLPGVTSLIVVKVEGNIVKFLKALTSSTIKNASSKFLSPLKRRK
jgi:hypothetical protein